MSTSNPHGLVVGRVTFGATAPSTSAPGLLSSSGIAYAPYVIARRQPKQTISFPAEVHPCPTCGAPVLDVTIAEDQHSEALDD